MFVMAEKIKREKLILAGIISSNDGKSAAGYSLDELRELVATAGGTAVGSHIIKKTVIDPSCIIGSGRLESLKFEAEELGAAGIVFDVNNIRPVQYNNLEKLTGLKILSRCDVILDIFALRASSAEAKIQVELAQLTNMLPRLRGQGVDLSRLGGGIGTRGPGETKLETDRRHIQRRIHRLNSDLKKIEKTRSVKRKSRSSKPKIAVAGYTNAGKSSLVSLLSKKDLFAENRLFATLDSFTREVYISPELTVLMTDTVGFIRNLPASLVKAFRSTFEEISFSDLIIHVVDSSNPNYAECVRTVDDELSEIGCSAEKIIFFNKTDAASADLIQDIKSGFPDALYGSVKDKSGIDLLKNRIGNFFKQEEDSGESHE